MTENDPNLEIQKKLAVLSYIWIVCIFVLFSKYNKKENTLLRNHLSYSLLFFILSIPIIFISSITSIGLLVLLVLALTGIVSAHMGKAYPLKILPRDKLFVMPGREFFRNAFNASFKISNFTRKEDELTKAEREDVIRFISGISYIWIIALFTNSLYKDQSEFIEYHSKKGKILFYLSLLFLLIPPFHDLLFFLLIVASVIGFLTAIQGKYLPRIKINDQRMKSFLMKINDFYRQIYSKLTSYYRRSRKGFKLKTNKEDFQNIMLCYLFLGPFFLFEKLNEDNAIVKFHAKQSTAFLILFIISLGLSFPINYAFSILFLSFMLEGFLHAFNNEEFLLAKS